MEDIIANLKQPVKNALQQLREALQHLSNEQYMQPVVALSNATIGQHVRHILELFICLEHGYESGVINYERRKRDIQIETDKEFSRSLSEIIYKNLHRKNKSLLLEASYDEHSGKLVTIDTNYYREVAYNLEHTVHHMALIRVGFNEISSMILPESFGVAASTIKYKKVCAQ
jgi:hypothetical protein